jgi:hypothetical protein
MRSTTTLQGCGWSGRLRRLRAYPAFEQQVADLIE